MEMPWKVSVTAEERERFFRLAVRRTIPVGELAADFGISRKTAYKWIRRCTDEPGPDRSEDRSRRPQRSPNATPPETVTALVALRKEYPRWGARKLLHLLSQTAPALRLPAPSTATSLLKKAGLVRKRRQRSQPRRVPVRPPRAAATAPNELWCVDYKGEFKLQNGQWCWPLTVTDAATRYLIACVALPRISMQSTLDAFERIFGEYGLPTAILSDNGTPFSAGGGVWGLTRLSARWVRYGIAVERTRPGKPQDNGRHERFHRTLKESTAMPPARTMAAQQELFDRFRREYNEVRPHEALRMKTPADFYYPSLQMKPSSKHRLSYPLHFHPCSASRFGRIQIRKQPFFVGRWAANETLGLEEIPGGAFRVYLGDAVLGELHVDTGLITYGQQGVGCAWPRPGSDLPKKAA